MKKIIFSFWGVVMLGLSGCIKKGDNIQDFGITPAIVGFDILQPVIKTPYGTLYAPELQSAMLTMDLMEGNTILTTFTINYDQQPSTEYYTVSNMQWLKVEKGWPSTYEAGDFNVPIEAMGVYDLVGNILFFGFQHTAPKDQVFIYEMTYDPESSDDIPVLYIRAKKVGTGTNASGVNAYAYAFDMSSYFYAAHKDAQNKVKFTISYKTGVDDEGNDKFEPYTSSYGIVTFEIVVE